MSRNNTVVVVNGRVRPINLDGALDITEKDQVDRWNKKMEKNHKKAVAIKIGIKQEPVGNVIDYITKKTGLKWLITKIFKECGCEKRRIYFNRWSIYIPFIYFYSQMNYKPIQAVEKTVTRLDNGFNEKAEPISREMLRKQKKPCACGKAPL